MNALFSVAGTSVLNGTTSYRVANDLNRARVLARSGHTDIALFALPHSMTRDDAIAYLATQGIVIAAVSPQTRAVAAQNSIDARKAIAHTDDITDAFMGSDKDADAYAAKWFAVQEAKVAAMQTVA